MVSMVYKNTVSEELLETAQLLTALPELNSFRMVGGTSIALQLGHRKSVDIDLFSNEKVNKSILANVLRKRFPNNEIQMSEHHVQADIKGIRIELYDDWQTPFRNEPLLTEGLRLASLMDLSAFKLNAITERREKKDYIDLYFVFNHLGTKNVLEKFKSYNPLLSPKSILFALGEVKTAEENNSVMPKMLQAITWREVKKSMFDAAKNFMDMQQKKKTTDQSFGMNL